MIRENLYLVNEKFLCYYGKTMDVSLLYENSIRIKGKKASLIVDPQTKMPKNQADMVLLLKEGGDLSKVEGQRLVIDDDGEYEVGGVKVTAQGRRDKGIFYNLNVDQTRVILAKVSTLGKLADTSNEADLAILDVDSGLDETLVASLESKVVVLYGEKASEGIKALGKNDVSPIKKLTTTKDKLPEETQIVWLA